MIFFLPFADSMEKQFSAMHENPDIIIATPGEIFKQSKTLISFYVLGQRILD